MLEEAIPALPEGIVARLLLSHILVQEDGDGVAAERVLRNILSLDPENAEAQANLAALRRRQGLASGVSARPGQ